MRKTLDFLYQGAGWIAALFMIGTLAMVLASVLGRMFNFDLRGSDAYAGYCMAAGSFLALAHTLKCREHIRVTLLLLRGGAKASRAMEIGCYVVGCLVTCTLAGFSIHLVWQSYVYNDVSQGADATPLWIPQLTMAVGATVLAIAFIDDFVTLLSGRELRREQYGQPAHME